MTRSMTGIFSLMEAWLVRRLLDCALQLDTVTGGQRIAQRFQLGKHGVGNVR